MEYEESIATLHSKHSTETKSLLEQLHDLDVTKSTLNQDIVILNNRMEQVRQETIQEQQEITEALRRRLDREKSSLEQDHKRSCMELEQVNVDPEFSSFLPENVSCFGSWQW